MSRRHSTFLDYEALFQEPTTEETLELMRSPEITGYRTRTIKSGDELESLIYPIYRKKTARNAKKAVTRAEQQRLNDWNSSRWFMRWLHTNFGRRDLFLTFTYAVAPTLRQAHRDIECYFKRVKRWRKKHGLPELKYLYVIEYEEDGRQVRMHSHVIMSDMDRDAAETLWGSGRTRSSRLQPDDKALEGLAIYLTKQTRKESKKGKRWNKSRNLTKPKDTHADHKFRHRHAERMVADCMLAAKEIFEKAYPGYELVECQAKASDRFPGAHIYAQLRRRTIDQRVRKGGGGLTLEIVDSYGGVRAMLDRRRNVELAQAALLRRMERIGGRGSPGSSWPGVEKLPDGKGFIFAPRGTNCPEGARQQQIEGHMEALERYIQANEALISHADQVIDTVRDSIDRAILLDYYCNGIEDSAIARQLHFARSSVCHRRNAAVEELEGNFVISPRLAT